MTRPDHTATFEPQRATTLYLFDDGRTMEVTSPEPGSSRERGFAQDEHVRVWGKTGDRKIAGVAYLKDQQSLDMGAES